jgi:2-oxoacid dehydrogenases acyltransferase (catalytic domain)
MRSRVIEQTTVDIRARSSVSSNAKRRRDRVALAVWQNESRARINAPFHIDADDLEHSMPHVSPVAAVGWAIGQALEKFPEVNRRASVFAIRQNKTVRVSFAVDHDDALQIAVVNDAHTFTPREFQKALIAAVRDARDPRNMLAMATRLLGRVPVVIGRPALRIWSALSAGMGVSIAGFGAAPFGAAMVSSVASFDLTAVSVPFVPFTRCAIVVSVGKSRPAAVIRDRQVTVRETIDVWVTADHRVCDGARFAEFTLYAVGLLTTTSQP